MTKDRQDSCEKDTIWKHKTFDPTNKNATLYCFYQNCFYQNHCSDAYSEKNLVLEDFLERGEENLIFTAKMEDEKVAIEYGYVSFPKPPAQIYNRFGLRVIARVVGLYSCSFPGLVISIVVDSYNDIYLHSHSGYAHCTRYNYKEKLSSIKNTQEYKNLKKNFFFTIADELGIQKYCAKKILTRLLPNLFIPKKDTKYQQTEHLKTKAFELLMIAIDEIPDSKNQYNQEFINIIREKSKSSIDKLLKCTNEIKKATNTLSVLATSVASLFLISCVFVAIAISSRYFIPKPPLNILHLKFALLAASSVFALSALCLAIKFALVSRSMIKNNMLQQKLHLKELFAEGQFDIANSMATDLTSRDSIYKYPKQLFKQLNQDIIILSLNFKAYAGKKLSDTELGIKENYLKDRKYSTKTNFLTTLSIYFFAIATIPAMSLFYYFGEVAKAPQSLKIVCYVCLFLTCISAIATVALYTESIVRGLSKIKENQTTEQDPAEIVEVDKNNYDNIDNNIDVKCNSEITEAFDRATQ